MGIVVGHQPGIVNAGASQNNVLRSKPRIGRFYGTGIFRIERHEVHVLNATEIPPGLCYLGGHLGGIVLPGQHILEGHNQRQGLSPVRWGNVVKTATACPCPNGEDEQGSQAYK